MLALILLAASTLHQIRDGRAIPVACDATYRTFAVWSMCLDRGESCKIERTAMVAGWAACHAAVDAHVIGK